MYHKPFCEMRPISYGFAAVIIAVTMFYACTLRAKSSKPTRK